MIKAIIDLNVEAGMHKKLFRWITQELGVSEVYLTLGDIDMAIIKESDDIGDLYKFVDKISKNVWVIRTVTRIIIDPKNCE